MRTAVSLELAYLKFYFLIYYYVFFNCGYFCGNVLTSEKQSLKEMKLEIAQTLSSVITLPQKN